MSEGPRYSRPPITEAVIDVRLKQSGSLSATEASSKVIGRYYKKQEPVASVELKIENGKIGTPIITQQGNKYIDENATDIALIQRSGLTISRLAPYSSWEDLFERFQRDWRLWIKRVDKMTDSCRLGLRYINRIDVPFKGRSHIKIEDYLNISVNAPDPNTVMPEYFVRFATPLHSGKFILIIQSGAMPPTILGHASFLLDIDIVCDAQRATQDNILDLFTEMRQEKNLAFEAFLTKEAKELFE